MSETTKKVEDNMEAKAEVTTVEPKKGFFTKCKEKYAELKENPKVKVATNVLGKAAWLAGGFVVATLILTGGKEDLDIGAFDGSDGSDLGDSSKDINVSDNE